MAAAASGPHMRSRSRASFAADMGGALSAIARAISIAWGGSGDDGLGLIMPVNYRQMPAIASRCRY
jgi:hypothetical protein